MKFKTFAIALLILCGALYVFTLALDMALVVRDGFQGPRFDRAPPVSSNMSSLDTDTLQKGAVLERQRLGAMSYLSIVVSPSALASDSSLTVTLRS